MKIIFLDIDGVVVNRASFRLQRVQTARLKTTAARAHPDCVAALNRITDETGAVFVLSSVWRMFGVKFMREWMKTCGITGKLIAMTPHLREREASSVIVIQRERGHEIQAWLDTKNGEVESFVILDDDADMVHLLPKLVQTQFMPGLTDEDAARAISFLK